MWDTHDGVPRSFFIDITMQPAAASELATRSAPASQL
jgi:hypothetical protein